MKENYSPWKHLANGYIFFVAMIFKRDISRISKKGKKFSFPLHPPWKPIKKGFLKIGPSHDLADSFLVFRTHECMPFLQFFRCSPSQKLGIPQNHGCQKTARMNYCCKPPRIKRHLFCSAWKINGKTKFLTKYSHNTDKNR